jgi:hypothetical protein
MAGSKLKEYANREKSRRRSLGFFICLLLRAKVYLRPQNVCTLEFEFGA